MTEGHDGFSKAETEDVIAKHGARWIVVQPSELPRWAYSIGLSERIGREVVFAGGAAIGRDELQRVLNAYTAVEGSQPALLPPSLEAAGWSVSSVDRSWASLTLAADRYYERPVEAIQLLPPPDRWTLDIPDLASPWEPETAGGWQWLDEGRSWPFPFARESVAFVDMAVLQRRRPARTAAQWDAGEWEVFSYSDEERENLDPKDVKPVPLATLIAADAGLVPIGQMDVGDALLRRVDGTWETWD